MLKLRRPESILLNDIASELNRYGRVSWIKWFKLRSNISFIEECSRKLTLIKDLSRYVSLFGSDIEKIMFLTDYCVDLCYRVCDKSYLEKMLESIPLIEPYYLRRYLLYRVLLFGYKLHPEETLEFVEEMVYGSTRFIIEDKLIMARVTAIYDFGYADDMFNFVLREIYRFRDAVRRMNLVKYAYYFSDSFRDKESLKYAAKLVDEALTTSDDYTLCNTEYYATIIPYLFSIQQRKSEKLLENLLRLGNTDCVVRFLDSAFFVLKDIDVYYRILEWSRRLVENENIFDFARVVSRIARNVVLHDPYLAHIFYENNQSLFVGLTNENIAATLDALKNIGFLDVGFVYEMAKILIREANDASVALRTLGELQDVFPRKVDELFKYEVYYYLRPLRIDELIDLSDAIYSINSEAARRLISRLIHQVDKSGDIKRKINRLLRIAQKIANIDSTRAEQLCMYTYELADQLPISEKISLTKRIIDILEKINPRYALEILQDIIEIIEKANKRELLIDIRDYVKNKEPLKQVAVYLDTKIRDTQY